MSERKAMTVKQAKPSPEDNEAMLRFLKGLEDIFHNNVHPDAGDSEDVPPLSDEDAFLWIRHRYLQSGHRFDRVFWAGRCAIDNACDPSLSYLEFKPEILAALSPDSR
jgi:hypothetical protein